MASKQLQGGGHVAVLAFPFSTHAGPLLNIVCRLAAAAPNTLFSFFNTKQSNTSILAASNTSVLLRYSNNVRVCDVADGVPEGYVFVGKPQEDIELFMRAAPDNFRRCLEASAAESGREVSCLVTDAFFWFGAQLAHDLGSGRGGVPWLPFWTAGPASLSAHVHTDLIRNTTTSMGGHDEKETMTLNIAGMSKVRLQDLPEGIIFGNLESLFSRMLHQMGQMLPLATAVFINSFEELDPVITNDLKSKFKSFLNVGPFDLLEPPASAATTTPQTAAGDGCLTWLDKQKAANSVVYVSFGSVTRPSPDELMALAEALVASRVPFLWSLRDNLKNPKLDEFLSEAELNGMVVPWVPQPQVLAHASVGAFVTHCGWNSVLESVAGGVPLICRPFFGDQKLNARMVEDVWKIGVRLEGGIFTKNGMLKSLDILLSQNEGRKMRNNINTLKQLAQQAVEPKGSSTRNFESLLEVMSTENVV